jgi:phosphonate degradation associated HDIG domain protein
VSAWRAWELATDATAACAALCQALREHGGHRYDEAVTQLEHALQSAALARAEGAHDALVLAALLHDVGHLIVAEDDRQPAAPGADLHHESVGARFLARWLPPSVTAPVALHVRAKRYLVGVDPTYAAGLSDASRRSLAVQGGPLTASEARAFSQHPQAEAAVAVRRWDDRAKTPGRTVDGLDVYTPALLGLMRQPP